MLEIKLKFTTPLVKELLELTPQEFLVFHRIAVALMNDNYNPVSLIELQEDIPVSRERLFAISRKLCEVGIFKSQDNVAISLSDYHSDYTERYPELHSIFYKIGAYLSSEELYLFFVLAFSSEDKKKQISAETRKNIAKKLVRPIFKSHEWAISVVEKGLVAKGFLAPPLQDGNRYTYLLYDGRGEKVFY